MAETPKDKDAVPEKIAPGGAPRGRVAWIKRAIGAVFLLYVTIRVWTLDPTGDEQMGRMPLPGLIGICERPEEQPQAPMYVLGTLAVDVLPFEPLHCLRIPSVIFFLLYLYAIGRLARLTQNSWFECLVFFTLLGNAYVLDWFSVARGYGMAYAFGALSLCLLCELVVSGNANEQRGKVNWSAWLGGIAAISLFTWLHCYIVICAILIFLLADVPRIWQDRQSLSRLRDHAWRIIVASLGIFASLAVVATHCVPRVVLMQTLKLLYSGGTTGFVHDTVASLVRRTLYGIRPEQQTWVTIAWIATALCLLMGVLAICIRNDSKARRVSILFFAVQLLHFFMVWAMHHIAGFRFVMNRGALTVMLLFSGQLVFFVAGSSARLQRYFAYLVLLVYLFFGLYSLNLDYTSEQPHISKQRKMMRDLISIHEATGKPILLGCSESSKLKIANYKKMWGLDWLTHYSISQYYRFTGQYRIHPQTTHFYLVHQDGKLPPGLEGLPLELLPYEYKHTENFLYRLQAGADLADYLKAPPQQPAARPGS